MSRINLWFVFALLSTVVVAEQFSYKFTLPTNLVTISSVVNGTSLRLTSPFVDYSGLAYYPTKVSANLGFSTNFTWIPEGCSTPPGAEGFAFFLTKDAPTYQQVSNSAGTGLGISNVPNTYIVGYSASSGQFYVCDWTTPLTTAFALSSQCSVTNIGPVQCGGRLIIKIFFDGTFWKVYNNNALLATVAKGIDLEHYFVGLSASNGPSSYAYQSITQWSFRSKTGKFVDVSLSSLPNNINFLGTAVPTSGSFQLNSGSYSAGAVAYNQRISPLTGFKTKFIWAPSNCDTLYGGADGFAFFAGVIIPSSSSVLQSQGSGLGVQYMNGYSSGNLVMTAYSATFNEFYICNWTDPRPELFRYFCYTVVNPTSKLTCGANYSVEVAYLGNQLSMSVDGVLKIASTNVIFDGNQYYIGISGATGFGYFQQDIYDWSLRYSDVFSSNFAYQYTGIGSATANSSASTATLTNGSTQAGAIYDSGWVEIDYKFESSFTWKGSNCVGAPTQGFSHFFSRLAPTANQIQTTPNELGIGNVVDVYMMGYDVRNNILFICDWGAPPTGFSSSVCSNAPMPAYTCGASLKFKMTYDFFTLKVYVNDTLKVSRSVEIYPRYYFIGFSGLTTSSSYMTQQITNWGFLGTLVGATQKFEYYGLPNTATFFGSAGETLAPWGYNMLKLTNGYYGTENAGLLLSPMPITMKYGFTAGGYWNASNCDPAYGGGNGFAYVFTKNVPTNSSVLASSGAGLGIQQVPDVTMVGYSSYNNEFYICSWASPLSGSYRNNPACRTISNSINAAHPQRFTCNEYLYFLFSYDSYNLRLTFYNVNGGQTSFDLVSTGPFPLDLSSSFFFGMSGSVGNGYYEQVSNVVSVRGFN